MQKISYTITDPLGIHARPAGLLVKQAQQYKDDGITMRCGDKSADLKKLFMVMKLGIKHNDLVTIEVEGPSEQVAADELLAYLQKNL